MTDLVLEPEPPAPKSRTPLVLALVALVVVVVGAIAVVAGGDDGPAEDPVTLLGSAPDAAREAGTARMAMQAEMSGEGMSIDFDGEGVVDFVTGDTSFEMSMFGMSIELRAVDGTMYMRMPELGRPSGMTQSWIAVPMGAFGAPETSPMAPNGTGFLESLRGISSDIEELGREEINGQEANGYRVIAELDKAMAQVQDEYRDDLEASMAQLESMGIDEWPMEVWLTDDGLPVRMVMDVKNDLFGMSMTIDYTDFGTDVHVEAPAEEDVLRVGSQQEMSELFGGGMTDLG